MGWRQRILPITAHPGMGRGQNILTSPGPRPEQHISLVPQDRGSTSPFLSAFRAAHPPRSRHQGSAPRSHPGWRPGQRIPLAVRDGDQSSASLPSPGSERRIPLPGPPPRHRIPFSPLRAAAPHPPGPEELSGISGPIPGARHSPSRGSSRRSAGRRSAMMGCAEPSPELSLRTARPGGAARGRGCRAAVAAVTGRGGAGPAPGTAGLRTGRPPGWGWVRLSEPCRAVGGRFGCTERSPLKKGRSWGCSLQKPSRAAQCAAVQSFGRVKAREKHKQPSGSRRARLQELAASRAVPNETTPSLCVVPKSTSEPFPLVNEALLSTGCSAQVEQVPAPFGALQNPGSGDEALSLMEPWVSPCIARSGTRWTLRSLPKPFCDVKSAWVSASSRVTGCQCTVMGM